MNKIHKPQGGFTLVEMIIVMVITGIIGGMVAVFIRAPVQGYVDSARRADMTDIADTALRRIARDLRLALPNSVRVTVDATGNTFLEFIPTTGGGRYRATADPAAAAAPCGAAGNTLEFGVGVVDTCFEVLGGMPTVNVGDQVVVYNLGIPGATAYSGNAAATDNRRPVSAVGANSLSITTANSFPFSSPGSRFQIVTTPVTYVCAPVAGGGAAGTLRRYWGYPIQAAQPVAEPIANANSALLATNVSGCNINYDGNVVAQRSGLVTMRLSITENGETVTLYSATHVSNVP